jgi:hypothetical protein
MSTTPPSSPSLATLHTDRLSCLRADSPVLGFNADSIDPLHFPSPDYSRNLPPELDQRNDAFEKVNFLIILTLFQINFGYSNPQLIIIFYRIYQLTFHHLHYLLHIANLPSPLIMSLSHSLPQLSLVSINALARSPSADKLPISPFARVPSHLILYHHYLNIHPLQCQIPPAMQYTSIQTT